MERIIRWMIYLSILTTSFDIFLAWQVAGTVRFTQVILIIPMLYMCICMAFGARLYLPPYIKWLFIWSAFLLAFVLNTVHIERTIGYWLWLMMSIFTIVLVVNMFHSPCHIKSLLRFYGVSFVFVALFGLSQFFLAPILHMSTPLVTQWWIPGILPRINGFSYEPSYFATYELIGWTFFFILKKNNNDLYSRKTEKIFLFILTLSIILSSSRMGIIIMLFLFLAPYLKKIFSFITGLIHGSIYISHVKKIIYTVLVTFFLFAGLVNYVDFSEYEFLLAGTGIGGTAAHSVDERSLAAEQTLQIFLDNPFIGVSLGGIPEKIADNLGIEASGKGFEGVSVFLEILAASGLVGVVPFLIYFFKLIYSGCISFLRMYDTVGLALIGALISEIIILQFNQNILRPYFWMHIAILSTYLYYYNENTSTSENNL